MSEEHDSNRRKPRHQGQGRPSGPRRNDDSRGGRGTGGGRRSDGNYGNRSDGSRGSAPGGRSSGSRDGRPSGSRDDRSDRPKWDGKDRPRGPRDDRSDRPKWDGDRPRDPRRESRPRSDSRGPDGDRRSQGGEYRRRDEEDVEEFRPPRPGTAPAPDEPMTPEDFDENLLPVGVKAELKGLPKELAEIVGAHVLAAGELIDEDPDLAYRHAEAARRRAGRLPLVREATAETAYASGRYDIALREFRALRRMNGSDAYLPAMADSERALGRPRDALELLGTMDPQTRDLALRIECLLVEAGIRNDLGQRQESLRLLQNAISRKIGPKLGQARLRYAYADMLEADGRTSEARSWFEAAGKLDADGALDTTERMAIIDGIHLPEDMSGGIWDDLAEEETPESEDVDPKDDESETADSDDESTQQSVEDEPSTKE